MNWPQRNADKRGLFLLLAVAAGLGACSKPVLTQPQVDPALSILIPPDTTMIAMANIEKLKKTSIYAKYLAERNVPQVDEIARFTGIDPKKDLWQLLFLSDGKHTVMLARGDFQSDMETHLQKNGATVSPYKMYHMVGDEQASVLFFNTSAAALGSVDSLKALVDARTSANGPPPAIAARLKEIPADAQIWAVYTGGGAKLPFDLRGNWANLQRIAASIDTAALYFDLRDGIKGNLRINTPGDPDGKQLNDTFRGLIGLGRLAAPSNQPDLLRILDGLQVSQEGAVVNVKIDEAADLIDKLLTLALGKQ